MRLKNYNEDLVFDTVKLVMKDRKDVKPSRSFMLDVAAYALNRIPPKYITSERGFTRELAGILEDTESSDRLLNVIELITLVNRAIDIVATRRKDGAPASGSRPAAGELAADQTIMLTYFYNIPHIFGRIVDAGDGTPVIDARATLYINDEISVPAEPGWRNPYQTHQQTKGYFSFWPRAEMGEKESLKAELAIGFNHPGYHPFTLKKSVRIVGEFFVYDYIRGDKILDLGTLALERA